MSAQLAEHQQSNAEAVDSRSTLEAQLRYDQETIQRLSAQVAQLQAEVADFEARFRDERQSAVKGMELLGMAQNQLSGLFRVLYQDGQNGNGHAPDYTAISQLSAPPMIESPISPEPQPSAPGPSSLEAALLEQPVSS
jgi:uncharacterized protein involved in exopolysaccharide biosynthesis